MRILVLQGGTSNEREISLKSAAYVHQSLEESGYMVDLYDTKQGVDSLEAVVHQYDVIFPVIHGAGGEDGSIQALLDAMRCHYVGSGVQASRLCFDKAALKERLVAAGIYTPLWDVVSANTFYNHAIAKESYVLKPVTGGSSIDTYVVRDHNNVSHIPFEEVFAREPKMLIEELIEGTEATVAVLDNRPLPCIEIIPPENEEFDYKNKYNGKSRELCPPMSISPEVQALLQSIALQVHQLAGARHYSRIDFMIRDETPYVLEINTIPGMTKQSLFPKAALSDGLEMPQLVEQLIMIASQNGSA